MTPPAPPPAGSSDTRNRILDAARVLITERGDAAITLVDVAARAGLSRQTLYLLFGSRAGLLLAMVDRIDAGAEGPRRLAMLRETLPPREAFAPYVRAWLGYLQVVYPVAHALAAAAATGDAEARGAWESRMQRLRGGFLQLTRALREAGALRPEWTPERAADWTYAATHVERWHHLVSESGWTAQETADRIVQSLIDDLIVPLRSRATRSAR